MNKAWHWLLRADVPDLNRVERATHTYVIGQSGTGKSKALESWILQDIRAGRGLALIDPHGDLYSSVLARLANIPDATDRLVLFDPLESKYVVGLNPLSAPPGISQERNALHLTDVVIKVWKLSPSDAPRMLWLLTNTFLALSNLSLTLLDLPRFLLDAEYREDLLPRLSNQTVRFYFETEYPHSKAMVHQWATPILNKLGNLMFDPDARQIFQKTNTINFRDLLDEQKILLVNLPKGILGEGLSSLLAAFIVAMIQQAALSRANTASRPPFYLYLDEFQNYTTDNISDILSESRKYSLSLILAHQYLAQLPPQLRQAVLNTAGTIVSFRIGHKDAADIAKEIFPTSNFLQRNQIDMEVHPSSRFPMKLKSKQANKGWDELAQELANLENREFWSRKRGGHKPNKQTSFWLPNVPFSFDLQKRIQAIKELNGTRYGQERTYGAAEQKKDRIEDDLPLWTA